MSTRRATRISMAVLAWLALPALTALPQGAGGPQETRPAAPPVLKAGAQAPDFELPVLKEDTDAKGQTVARISDQKVRLSSFRGKKVVCLFLSSYT